MKKASIDIEVKAMVDGKEVECELSPNSKVIINGNLTVNNIELEPNEK